MIGEFKKFSTQIVNGKTIRVCVLLRETGGPPYSWVCRRRWHHRMWMRDGVIVSFRRKPGRPYRLISNWAVNVRPVKWWKFLLFW